VLLRGSGLVLVACSAAGSARGHGRERDQPRVQNDGAPDRDGIDSRDMFFGARARLGRNALTGDQQWRRCPPGSRPGALR